MWDLDLIVSDCDEWSVFSQFYIYLAMKINNALNFSSNSGTPENMEYWLQKTVGSWIQEERENTGVEEIHEKNKKPQLKQSTHIYTTGAGK